MSEESWHVAITVARYHGGWLPRPLRGHPGEHVITAHEGAAAGGRPVLVGMGVVFPSQLGFNL